MKLTLNGNLQNLHTLIATVLFPDATDRANARVPLNVSKLYIYMPDIAANAAQSVSWGDDTLAPATNVGEKGVILPGQRIPIYDFETNQGSLINTYLDATANNVVIDVEYVIT
jgi:hypothetical protein